ncbi:hypothetical protein ACO0RG_004130 [Hanseniaspora osmophila]
MSFNFAGWKKNLQDLSNNAMQAATDAQLDLKFHKFSESVGNTVSSTTSNLPGLAAKTQRYVEEKMGRVTDISQLPSEFTELENRVLRYKMVYESLLKVTSTFDNESYDYPQHIKESFNSWQSTITQKALDLSKASNASEAQKILINDNKLTGSTDSSDSNADSNNQKLSHNLEFPKTLNYALSKASLQSCEILNKSAEDENLAADFLKFSNIQQSIGDFRLEQDTQIQLKFNKPVKIYLHKNFQDATNARKLVNDSRLEYDIARSNLANNRSPEKEAELRQDMEKKEDKFAQDTEDAIMVFTKVLHESEVLDHLKAFVNAQIDYHKKCLESLNDLQF